MSEATNDRLSRRSALKALLGLAAAGALVKVGADKLGASGDINRDENLKEILQGEELFPGVHSYYDGKVNLREGTQVYNHATYELKPKAEGAITVPSSGNTRAGELKESITIERPFVFLK